MKPVTAGNPYLPTQRRMPNEQVEQRQRGARGFQKVSIKKEAKESANRESTASRRNSPRPKLSRIVRIRRAKLDPLTGSVVGRSGAVGSNGSGTLPDCGLSADAARSESGCTTFLLCQPARGRQRGLKPIWPWEWRAGTSWRDHLRSGSHTLRRSESNGASRSFVVALTAPELNRQRSRPTSRGAGWPFTIS
jgi:hypothetical protein